MVDLSPENVTYLRGEFPDPRVAAVVGDIEGVSLDQRFDLIISSLTFKHLYPTFAVALGNSAAHLEEEGLIVFDLIESTAVERLLRTTQYFQNETTYLRRYSRGEVAEILDALGLRLVAFDTVSHDADNQRMLVVARKSG